jgi:class 3 adenylate cyclase
MPRGSGAVVHVGPLAIGWARLEPGWRWSVDVRPVVGTEWCEAHHVHVLLAGRFAVLMAGADAPEEFAAGDVFDIPPGHDAWAVGDEPVELIDVSGNVAEFGQPVSSARLVATILMTDIVDSTPTAARLGDERWRQVLADHNRLVRAQLSRFRGRELDTTGDGFLAMFDSAVGAVRCASAIRDTIGEVGLAVRVGVHTGEIEVTPDGARGVAIHALARILASAGPQEILVSPVTVTLTEGAGLRYADRGEHQLKGIDAPMRLFAVE